MSDLIPQYTLTADGEVIQHEGGSQIVSSSRESTDVNTEIVAIDATNSLAALDRRVEVVRAKLDAHVYDRNGVKHSTLSPAQHAAFQRELDYLEGTVRPYEELNAAAIVQRQAAARAQQTDKLQAELDQRNAIEARAHELALEEQAKALAARMARHLHL